MTRYALILCAGILAAACAACVPHPPQTSEPVPTATLALPSDCALNDVRLLDASFNPTSLNETPRSNVLPPQSIINDLVAAYNIAPPFFQKRLCTLDGIFITKGLTSGGYRNIEDGKRYIALSMPSLWPDSQSPAIPLHEYHNDLLKKLLDWPSSDGSPPKYGPAVYSSRLPNEGTMTVLAVLAHELGHVQWPDILVDFNRRGDPPDFNRLCPGTFPDKSWKAPPPHRRWQRFLIDRDDNNQNIDDSQGEADDPVEFGDPQYADIKVERLLNALSRGNIPRAEKILKRLHSRKRPWPSLFGAWSVNEQFVETFTLLTLINAKPALISLPLNVKIGTKPIRRKDIPKTISERPRLQEMMLCLATWYASNP